jgi:photosystem II stability/assembly factor-like uncharacterized protein
MVKLTFSVKAFAVLSVFLFINRMDAQWSQVSLPNVTINCLTANNDASVLFAGTDSSGIYSTSNNGDSWQRKDNGVNTISCNSISTQTSNYLAGTNNGLYVSQDNGNTWSTNSAITGITDSHINTVSWDYSGTYIFVGTNSGIFIMAPGKQGQFAPGNTGLTNLTINVLYDFKDPHTKIENTWCGTNAGLFVSSDMGAHWTATPVTNRVNALIANSLVCTSAGFIEDNFNTRIPGWSELLVSGLEDTNLLSEILYPKDPDHYLYVGSGTNGKVYCSTDWGSSWKDVSGGLKVKKVKCLFQLGPYLIAGTDNGIWRITLQQLLTSIEDDQRKLADNFSLFQNFPNPFNPSTNINYSVPKTSIVTIKVYNILGKELTTLVNEEKSAGNYSVKFNGKQLSSGIYFYKMQAGNFVETKKLVLMK